MTGRRAHIDRAPQTARIDPFRLYHYGRPNAAKRAGEHTPHPATSLHKNIFLKNGRNRWKFGGFA